MKSVCPPSPSTRRARDRPRSLGKYPRPRCVICNVIPSKFTTLNYPELWKCDHPAKFHQIELLGTCLFFNCQQWTGDPPIPHVDKTLSKDVQHYVLLLLWFNHIRIGGGGGGPRKNLREKNFHRSRQPRGCGGELANGHHPNCHINDFMAVGLIHPPNTSVHPEAQYE